LDVLPVYLCELFGNAGVFTRCFSLSLFSFCVFALGCEGLLTAFNFRRSLDSLGLFVRALIWRSGALSFYFYSFLMRKLTICVPARRLSTFFLPNFISYAGYFTPPFRVSSVLLQIISRIC